MVPADSDRIPRAPPYSGGQRVISTLPIRDCHPLRPFFPKRSGSVELTLCRLLQPLGVRKHPGLGSAPFARHYSGYRFFLSLPPGTKMFQFPGFAPSIDGGGSSTHRVSPFGHARITTCLRFPVPFRSLPRPSSPPDSLGIHRSLLSSFLIAPHPSPDKSRDSSRRSADCESFLILLLP